MQLINDSIKTIFGRMPILNISIDRNPLPIDSQKFIKALRVTDRIHTDDQLLINLQYLEDNYCSLDQSLGHMLSSYGDRSIFNILLNFSGHNLNIEESAVSIKYENLLKWHDVTSFLGEDLFTTAFMAAYDHHRVMERLQVSRDMHWDNTLKCDNQQITELFEKNLLSDIHFHLKGSSSNFNLIWLYLMNYTKKGCETFEKVDGCNLLGIHLADQEQVKFSLSNLILKASILRLALTDATCSDLLQKINDENVVDVKNELEKRLSSKLQTDEVTRILYNAEKHITDYIYSRDDEIPVNDTFYFANSIHSERRFLYTQFKRILEDVENSQKLSSLMYQYILLKSIIRREFVQLYDSIGFNYFSMFDDRKSPEDIYKSLIPHIAVASSAVARNRYVEARIAPPQKEDNEEYSLTLRKAIERNLSSINPSIENNNEKHHKDEDWKFDFVIHFIKKKDKCENLHNIRHAELREQVQTQAIGIYKILNSKNLDINLRIVGIDAANSEIACRPEIFAVTFRFLSAIHKLCESHQIGITYHVGEDFLDVVDGLRAIDEVMLYMNFGRGSRFGHALVLGADVNAYYHNRDNRVELPSQILLDNLAWLYLYSDIIKTPRTATKNKIRDEFQKCFNEVYGSIDKIEEYSINDYIDSWRLRGDNPKTYIEGRSEPNLSESLFAQYYNNLNEQCIQSRSNEKAKELYIHYHTSPEVKTKGSVIRVWKVNQELITLIDEIRLYLLDIVESKGIHIECNPTSNLRIGALRRYDAHPIIEFNNDIFYKYRVALNSFPKRNLSVSINTDDKGIFDTSLEREISLIIRALDKKIGTHPHRIEIIMEWIAYVIQEGNRHAFKSQY